MEDEQQEPLHPLAIEAKDLVSRMVNVMGRKPTEDFIKLMGNEHRTLQQNFTRLCLMWIEHCASDNFRTDLRNEDSKTVSKQIVELFENQLDVAGLKPSQFLAHV